MEFEHRIITPLTSLLDLAPAGFVISLHIRFMSPAYMFLTYPLAWRDIYSRHGYLISDPTVRWGMSHEGHVFWGQLAQYDPAGVLKHAARFGMRHGLTIARGDGESRSIGSFTRADRDHDPAEVECLLQDFTTLHEYTRNLARLSPETSAALRRLSITITHP